MLAIAACTSSGSSFANETARVTQIFAELLKIADQPDQAIVFSCKLVVNRLAAVFSKITGAECSVCIKVVFRNQSASGEEERKPYVVTLARDDSSSSRERHGGTLHYVHLNTDFSQLFGLDGKSSRYFFSNDLRRLREYRNTSFAACGGPPRYVRIKGCRVPVLNALSVNRTWKLPYRSTIVVPVSPDPSKANRIVGYLCVDSSSTRKFQEAEDVELMAGVSRCLYPAAMRYRRMLRNRSRR